MQLDVQLLPVIEGTFKPESTGDSHDKGYPRKRLMSQCESNDTWSRLRSDFGENFAWNDKASTREVLLKLLNIDPSLANVSTISQCQSKGIFGLTQANFHANSGNCLYLALDFSIFGQEKPAQFVLTH